MGTVGAVNKYGALGAFTDRELLEFAMKRGGAVMGSSWQSSNEWFNVMMSTAGTPFKNFCAFTFDENGALKGFEFWRNEVLR